MGKMTVFGDCDRPLEIFSSFNYLVCLLTATYNDCLAVVSNIWKVRKSWSFLALIVGQEGVDTWNPGHFNISAIQVILLFGSEMWVVSPHIKRILGSFHHRVVWWI